MPCMATIGFSCTRRSHRSQLLVTVETTRKVLDQYTETEYWKISYFDRDLISKMYVDLETIEDVGEMSANIQSAEHIDSTCPSVGA